MKNLKKMNRENLKSINGGSGPCNETCPPGPYGPGPNFPSSCKAYNALSKCCQSKVLVHIDCVNGGVS